MSYDGPMVDGGGKKLPAIAVGWHARRQDGTPLTKPAAATTKAKRRRRNQLAKQARRTNR